MSGGRVISLCKGLKQVREEVGGDTHSRIFHFGFYRGGLRRFLDEGDKNSDIARFGEFDSIPYQVHEYLAEAARVATQGGGNIS